MAAKTGRPLTEIDKNEFEKLCGLQCTQEEICSFFGTTPKTLQRWCRRTYGAGFSQVFAEKRRNGKIALRRAQFRLAQKNAAMAIFLGKQWLGQKDMDRVEVGGIIGQPIETEEQVHVQIYLPDNKRGDRDDDT